MEPADTRQTEEQMGYEIDIFRKIAQQIIPPEQLSDIMTTGIDEYREYTVWRQNKEHLSSSLESNILLYLLEKYVQVDLEDEFKKDLEEEYALNNNLQKLKRSQQPKNFDSAKELLINCPIREDNTLQIKYQFTSLQCMISAPQLTIPNVIINSGQGISLDNQLRLMDSKLSEIINKILEQNNHPDVNSVKTSLDRLRISLPLKIEHDKRNNKESHTSNLNNCLKVISGRTELNISQKNMILELLYKKDIFSQIFTPEVITLWLEYFTFMSYKGFCDSLIPVLLRVLIIDNRIVRIEDEDALRYLTETFCKHIYHDALKDKFNAVGLSNVFIHIFPDSNVINVLKSVLHYSDYDDKILLELKPQKNRDLKDNTDKYHFSNMYGDNGNPNYCSIVVIGENGFPCLVKYSFKLSINYIQKNLPYLKNLLLCLVNCPNEKGFLKLLCIYGNKKPQPNKYLSLEFTMKIFSEFAGILSKDILKEDGEEDQETILDTLFYKIEILLKYNFQLLCKDFDYDQNRQVDFLVFVFDVINIEIFQGLSFFKIIREINYLIAYLNKMNKNFARLHNSLPENLKRISASLYYKFEDFIEKLKKLIDYYISRIFIQLKSIGTEIDAAGQLYINSINNLIQVSNDSGDINNSSTLGINISNNLELDELNSKIAEFNLIFSGKMRRINMICLTFDSTERYTDLNKYCTKLGITFNNSGSSECIISRINSKYFDPSDPTIDHSRINRTSKNNILQHYGNYLLYRGDDDLFINLLLNLNSSDRVNSIRTFLELIYTLKK